MKSRRVCLMLLTIVLAGGAAHAEASGAEAWQPDPLPRAEEIREALAACPEALQPDAGIYVLTSAGFELERESTNGFHAIIQRSQPGAFEPECFDAEGSGTILKMVLMKSRLRMAGSTQDDIDLVIGRAWASGELSAPTRPGVNYMLSEHNKVPVGPETVIPYQPHVMFYAPYLTNADLGAEPMGSAPIFVVNEGMPNAYVIVPVGSGEEHEGH
jgi:hypothetical protein